MDYLNMLARAAGLIPVVMILVAAIKKMGLEGVWLTRASFILGLSFGMLTEAAVLTLTPDLLWWVSSVIYGLLIGAGACGAYDLGDRWFKKPAPEQSGQVVVSPEWMADSIAQAYGDERK